MFALSSLRLRALASDVTVKVTYIGSSNKPVLHASGTLASGTRNNLAEITGQAVPGECHSARLEIDNACVIAPAYGAASAEIMPANDGDGFDGGTYVIGREAGPQIAIKSAISEYWRAASGITSVTGTAFWLHENNTGAGGIDDSATLSKDRTHVIITALTGAPLNIRVGAAASTSARTVQAYPGGDPVPVLAGPGDRVSVIASDGITPTTFEARQVRAEVKGA